MWFRSFSQFWELDGTKVPQKNWKENIFNLSTWAAATPAPKVRQRLCPRLSLKLDSDILPTSPNSHNFYRSKKCKTAKFGLSFPSQSNVLWFQNTAIYMKHKRCIGSGNGWCIYSPKFDIETNSEKYAVQYCPENRAVNIGWNGPLSWNLTAGALWDPRAAKLLKSTSGQIQDGETAPKFVSVKLL